MISAVDKSSSRACRIGTLLVLRLALCLMSGCLSSAWASTCPSIPFMSYNENVPETAPIGSFVLTVAATANPGETLSFTIFDDPTEEPSFEVDSATGNLTLARALDYETRSTYDFGVLVVATGCMIRVDIAISVVNENDNFPQCASHVLYSSVQENSTLTLDSLATLSCTDGDETELSYQFTSGNEEEKFSIDLDGRVSTTEALDYESQSVYELTILVLDSGFAIQHNTTVKLFILVEPVNEYAPKFANSTYEFYVYESASVGSLVGQPTAVDHDLGADGTIRYSLSPGGDSDTFTVCSENGYVYLRRALDFETASSYEFSIIASDSSLPEVNRLTSTATILVHIKDSNEHDPSFTQSIYSAQVPEEDETETGSNITQLTCVDGDSGINQEMVYTIISGNEEDKFDISSSGQITFKSTSLLDFELGTQLFELTVQCMDGGQPPRSSTALVVLEVTSVNDHDPVPSSTEYELNVAEDTLPGTSIAQVQAYDQDRGPAGVLSYSLTTCPSGLLHIDPADGTVYLMGELDYELGPVEIFCVASVRDSQQPVRDREVDLILTVTDVNDEPPVCDPSIRLFSIYEDTAPGYVMTFSCSDPDSPTLQYSIPGGSSYVPFEVNPTGDMITLSLQSQLDYENQSSYSFPIEVSDDDFTTTVGVHISVLDRNEHTPTFSTGQLQCNISEDAQVGAIACELTATDIDGGTLSYQMINSTDNETFCIDPLAGNIVVSAPLDYEAETEYTFIVEVRDSGSPVHSSLATVQIVVMDENDHAPTIEPLLFAAISENASLGIVVASLVCRDQDSGNNGETALEITATLIVLPSHKELTQSESPFAINSTSGHLTISDSLDYEAAALYEVQVVCRDYGAPNTLSSFSTVTIEVLPVNEFVPSFESQHYNASIAEDSSVGSSILRVQALDSDLGEDGEIVFYLNSTELLHIDPYFGTVTLGRPADCTNGTVYHYTLEARDKGRPSLSGEVQLEVHIVNCSLGTLVPDRTLYTASIVEGTPLGTNVLNVSCTGTRESLLSNQQAPQYSMLPSDSSPFDVDTQTGQVSVSSPLDYETSTFYDLTLQCYDPNNSLDAAVNISAYIAILPENEHSPEFTEEFYTVEVAEDTALGSTILRVQADDMDGGEDGRISYSIQQANHTFGIDSTTATIYLTDFLDYETIKRITFQVTAEDNPHEMVNSRHSHVNITVVVRDSNDNQPECQQSFLHIVATRLTAVGSTLAELMCEDRDQGQNAVLEYAISNNTAMELFAIDSTSGVVTLLGALDPSVAAVHLVPIAVKDGGNPSLTSTVVVIVDVQDPLNLIDDGNNNETGGEDNISQIEVEGRGNSVTMVLRDLSLELWDQEGEEKFRDAIARSVTHYCALLPEACSLVSGCTEFYGRRKRRNVNGYYASFMQPNVRLLEPPTELRAEDSTNVTSLEVTFYVTLPDQATKSPLRETDYVIPRGTLNIIVQQDSTVVEAVVRDSVAPPLTQPAPESEKPESETTWSPGLIVAVVVAAVLFSVIVLGIVCTVIYKLKKGKSSKIQVHPIPPAGRIVVRETNSSSTHGQRSGVNRGRGSGSSRLPAGHQSGSSSLSTDQSPDNEQASMEPNSRSSFSSTELDSNSLMHSAAQTELGREREEGYTARNERRSTTAGTVAGDYLENWLFTPPGAIVIGAGVRQGHARPPGWGGAWLNSRPEFRINSRNNHWRVH